MSTGKESSKRKQGRLSTFFRFFLQKYDLRLWTAIVFCSVVAAVCEGVSFQSFYYALCALSLGEQVHSTNALFVRGAFIYFFFAVICQMIRALGVFGSALFFAKLSTKIQLNVQNALVAKLFSFSFPYVSRKKKGALSDLFSIPSACFSQLFTHIHSLLNACIFFSVLFLFMLKTSLLLTLFTMAAFTCIGTIYRWTSKKAGKRSQLYRASQSALQASIAEWIAGMRMIHSGHLQKVVQNSVETQLNKSEKPLYALNLWNAAITYSFELIGICHVAFLLGLSYLIPSVTIALLGSFIGLSYRFAQKLPVIAQSISFILANWGNLSALSSFLDEEDSKPPRIGKKTALHPPQNMQIKDLSFCYEQEKTWALRNIDLTISLGQTIGFVGTSGSGKSSFFDLLLRLYEPQKGGVFADGQEYREFDLAQWRALFGVVAQDTFLLHRTIDENLRLGNESASAEELDEACRLSGAHLFIDKLPKQKQTLLGELGAGLSGGEKQRLAIARALVKKPAILLLDEATSHLDSASEQIVLQSLRNLQGKITILIIAHQLRSVQNADRIYVFQKGRVVESGVHEELLQRGLAYHALWGAQLDTSKTTSSNFARNRAY